MALIGATKRLIPMYTICIYTHLCLCISIVASRYIIRFRTHYSQLNFNTMKKKKKKENQTEQNSGEF